MILCSKDKAIVLAALKDARVYVDCAYESAFPNEAKNELVLKEIDLAIALLSKPNSPHEMCSLT